MIRYLKEYRKQKQSNFLQIVLFSKLANNSKLTSNKHKKYLTNNLHLYYSTEDHKLDFYFKKQTMVTSKGCSTLATANPLAAIFEKPLEKQSDLQNFAQTEGCRTFLYSNEFYPT